MKLKRIPQKASEVLQESFSFFFRRTQPRLSTERFKELGKNLVGAEVGYDKGKNARVILKEVSIKYLCVIDINLPDELSRQDRRFVCYTGDSNWASRIIPFKLDFVYIDGDHSYKQVKKDIENYWKKVKKGGILAGHDIDKSNVFKAVSEFAVKNKLNVEVDFQDWVIKKEGRRR